MPRARYDELADWYNDVMQDPAGHEPLASSAFDLLGRLMGQGRGTVLDIGCGTGLAVETVRALGYQPVGLDVSSDQSARGQGTPASSSGRRRDPPSIKWLDTPRLSTVESQRVVYEQR